MSPVQSKMLDRENVCKSMQCPDNRSFISFYMGPTCYNLAVFGSCLMQVQLWVSERKKWYISIDNKWAYCGLLVGMYQYSTQNTKFCMHLGFAIVVSYQNVESNIFVILKNVL